MTGRSQAGLHRRGRPSSDGRPSPLAGPGTPPYEDVVTDYLFSQSHDGSLVDRSANGFDFTVTGSLDAVQIESSGVYVSGGFSATDYAENASDFDLNGDMTFIAMVRTTDGSYKRILETGDLTASQLRTLSKSSTTGYLDWSMNASSVVATSDSISDGDWHLICCKLNGTSASVGVDGAFIKSATLSVATFTELAVHFGIDNSHTNFFPGDLGLFRIYDRGITAQEFSDIWDSYATILGL